VLDFKKIFNIKLALAETKNLDEAKEKINKCISADNLFSTHWIQPHAILTSHI
jgi:hypothetical protein